MLHLHFDNFKYRCHTHSVHIVNREMWNKIEKINLRNKNIKIYRLFTKKHCLS